MKLLEHRPFFTSIYTTVLGDDLSEVYKTIKQEQALTSTVAKSNIGGWQSESHGMGDYAVMDDIVGKIVDPLIAVYDSLAIRGTPTLRNYWFNVNGKYNYNTMHNHPYCVFSAILYIKTPANSGKVAFMRPDPFENFIPIDSSKKCENNFVNYKFTPHPNLLILFPSYLYHHVEQNLTEDKDDERISIAFNFGI